jgi:phage major head subunit gpT-like protein
MSATGLGFRNIIGRFYARLEAVTATGWQDLLSVLMPTDQESEVYKWLGQTPGVREWIGGRQSRGFRENGITIVNKLFEATLELNVDERRRDKTGQIQVRIDELAERTAEHYHKLLTSLIVTPGTGYDGAAFFATSHTEGDSGTQDNALVAGTVPALDVVLTTAPTPAEMSACIIGVVAKMLAIKDDQGEPMNSAARSFAVMVPPNLWAATAAALGLPIILSGSAAINNLLPNLNGFNFIPIVNPRLTTTTVFYVFRTDATMKPFIRQEELFETGTWDETFLNNRTLFGVKALRNVGTAYWQYAAKATLS